MPQGRPKTDDNTKMMINFTEKTADKLRERKEKTGLPVSWQVRTAVDKYLEDND